MATMVELGPSSGEAGLWLVSSKQVPLIWPKVEEIVLEKGGELAAKTDPDDLFKSVLSDGLDLWVGVHLGKIEIVVFMLMVSYPKRKVYQVLWAGGSNVKKYLPMDKIEQYGVLAGACELEVAGRSGWVRLLPSYEVAGVILRKNIARRWGN